MVVLSKKKNVKPEKILEDIEKHLKNIAEKKKEIEKNFTNKFKELENQAKENEKWFKKEREKLEKLENQLILWWDFWKREVKINSLREKTEIGTLPSEREAIMEEIQNLNTYNKTIEKGIIQQVEWNGSKLVSGTYIVCLQTPTGIERRKIVLAN